MKFIKIVLVASIIMFLSSISYAQDKANGKSKKDKIEVLTEKLDLNEEQAAKLKVIYDDFNKKKEELKKKAAPLKAELKTLKKEGQELKESNDKEVEQILTPEQLEKLKALKAERNEKRNVRKNKANGKKKN